MSEEKTEEAAGEAAKPKKASSGMVGKFLLLLSFLGAQVGVGLMVAKMIAPQQAAEHEAKKAAEDAKEHPADAEGGAEHEEGVHPASLEKPIDLTGMIAGAPDHYWVLQVNFEWDATKYPKMKDMLDKERKPLVMDAVNQIASAKQMPDWQAPDAMINLRKAILQDINTRLPKEEGQIRKVFITKFLVQ